VKNKDYIEIKTKTIKRIAKELNLTFDETCQIIEEYLKPKQNERHLD
jgi:hypothetical protein